MPQPITILIALSLLSITCMSLVPVLIKLTTANIATIGIARLGIACALLTPLCFWKQAFNGLHRRDWLVLLLIGVVFFVHWWTYFYSIKNAGGALAAIAVATYGIHLLLISRITKKQKNSPLQWFSIALCFLGCYLVSPTLNFEQGVSIGFLVGILSGFLYALLPSLHQQIEHVSTLTRTWAQFSIAGLCFLSLWPLSEWSTLEGDDWSMLITLGIVCTLIAHGLWVKVSTELPSVLVSATYYLYIPLAMVLSLLFLNEAITWQRALGATFIIGGNLLIIFAPTLKPFMAKN